MIVKLLLIVLCGLCDAIRGGLRPVKWIEYPAKFGYGAFLALLITNDWRLIIATSVLWWLGEKPGWGFPSGWVLTGKDPRTWKQDAEPEKWQKLLGIENMPLTSLLIRGLIWCVPVLPLAYFNTGFIWLIVVAPIAMLSPYIASYYPFNQKNKGHFNEFLRGCMMGSGLILLRSFYG